MKASKRSREIAARRDADLRMLENAGISQCGKLAIKMRSELLKAYNSGLNPASVIPEVVELFQPLIVDAMVSAHLWGRLESFRTADEWLKSKKALAAKSPYAGASGFLEKRLELSEEELSSLQAMHGQEAVRVTGSLSSVLEQRTQQAMNEIVQKGAHVREGMSILRKEFEAAGLNNVQPYMLESIVRTQTQLAYGAGRWNANQDPVIQEILWGYEYVTVGDDRVRPNHVGLEGVKLPKDDPRWAEIWPPNGYNCRCEVVEIFDEGKEKPPLASVEVDGVQSIPGPDKGWDFHPGHAYRDTLRISTGDLPVLPNANVVQGLVLKSEHKLPATAVNAQMTKKEVFNAAKEANKQFGRVLDGIASDLNAETFRRNVSLVEGYAKNIRGPVVIHAPMKASARAAEKVLKKFNGNWTKATDIVRGTVGVDSIQELPKAVNSIRKQFAANGFKKARVPKNRFLKPGDDGYRDLLMNFQAPNGQVVEIQVHLKPILVIKQGKGHKIYEQIRSLSAFSKKYQDGVRRMKKLYDDAWLKCLNKT